MSRRKPPRLPDSLATGGDAKPGRPESAEHPEPAWRRRTVGEPRWPAAVAALAAITVHLLLPADLAPRPRWLLPALEFVLFLLLVAANPYRVSRESRILRTLALSMVAVVSVATATSAALLVRELLRDRTNLPPTHLLAWAGAIWLTNVLVFALWYWEADRGGPAARANGRRPHPDFMFPQMQAPELVHRDWEPAFVDYLYVSFTNATAFSPTDTMPMSRWAKLTMMAQAAISMVTVLLAVARAINVLGS